MAQNKPIPRSTPTPTPQGFNPSIPEDEPIAPTKPAKPSAPSVIEKAARIKTGLYPVWMSMAAEMPEMLDVEGLYYYLDQLLQECIFDNDFGERMLIEQLAIIRLRLGLLHVRAAKAANADQTQAMESYGTAANRLLIQFRQLIETLHSHRTATARLTPERMKSRQ